MEEVWNKNNFSVLNDIVSNDFVIHSLNLDNEVHGQEGIMQFYTSLLSAFPDLKFTIKDQVAEGDKVTTQWIAEGTHQGTFEGILATGKHFKVAAIDIDHIRNSKISLCWTQMEELSLLKQLGALNTNNPDENPQGN